MTALKIDSSFFYSPFGAMKTHYTMPKKLKPFEENPEKIQKRFEYRLYNVSTEGPRAFYE